VATNGTPTRSFGYNGTDNIGGDTRGSAAWSFTHNVRRRLSAASVGGVAKTFAPMTGSSGWRFGVVSNAMPLGTSHLIYDTARRVLAEANGISRAILRAYVWLEIGEEDARAAARSGGERQ